MAIPFTTYLEIKDNYCLTYFGNSSEIINLLIEKISKIEKELPGINIYLAVLDSFKNTLNFKNIIFKSELDQANKCIFYREINNLEDIEEVLKV
jgi:hypothetical protein